MFAKDEQNWWIEVQSLVILSLQLSFLVDELNGALEMFLLERGLQEQLLVVEMNSLLFIQFVQVTEYLKLITIEDDCLNSCIYVIFCESLH